MTMRTLIFAMTAIAMGSSASAQQPKAIRTVPVQAAPAGAGDLYEVDDDGTVHIDWRAVEQLKATESDRTHLPIAQLMLAIRDRTWKPMD
jgi:hypothetical protein